MQLFPDLKPQEPDPNDPRTALRALYGDESARSRTQALSLLQALNDPELWWDLASGVWFDGGNLQVRPGSDVDRYVHPDHRTLLGVYALAATGALPPRMHLWRANGLRDLSFVLGAHRIEELDIDGPDLSDISALEGLESLTTLRLWGCSKLRDIQSLTGLTALKDLHLSRCAIVDLTPLSGLSGLRNLKINGNLIPSLGPLSTLRLESIELDNCIKVADLSPLANMDSLQRISAQGTSIVNLGPLRRLNQIDHLDISKCAALACLSGIEGLSKLTLLSLEDSPLLYDLEPLAALTHLQSLDLKNLSPKINLAPLSKLTQVKRLCLQGCTNLTDLRPLAEMKSLESLYLERCPSLSDLGPLSALTALERLSINGGSSLHDLDPLWSLPLTWLHVRDCPGVAMPPDWDGCKGLSIPSFLLGHGGARRRAELQSSCTATQRRTLRVLRAGLAAQDWATVQQAIELAWGLNDPILWAILTSGIGVITSPDETEAVCPLGSEIHARVEKSLQEAAMLEMLRLDGRLSPVVRLSVRELPLEEIYFFRGLDKLQHLTLTQCFALRSADGLTGLSALERLDLSHARALVDISALADLPALQELRLRYCYALRDLSPLYTSKTLTTVHADGVHQPALDALQAALPGCTIHT